MEIEIESARGTEVCNATRPDPQCAPGSSWLTARSMYQIERYWREIESEIAKELEGELGSIQGVRIVMEAPALEPAGAHGPDFVAYLDGVEIARWWYDPLLQIFSRIIPEEPEGIPVDLGIREEVYETAY